MTKNLHGNANALPGQFRLRVVDANEVPHRPTLGLQISGDVMQSQDFDIIAAHAIDGDVVLVQNQFAGAGHPASAAHARVDLQLGDSLFQLEHKAGGPGRVVLGNESGNLISGAKRSLGPFQRHVSGAVFRKHGLDLIVGGELASIGFLDTRMDVTNLPGLALYIVGQRIDGEVALAPCSGLGQRFNLVIEGLGQAHVDGFGSHGCNTQHCLYYKELSVPHAPCQGGVPATLFRDQQPTDAY